MHAFIVRLTLAFMAIVVSSTALAANAIVFAAASLKESMDEQAHHFEAATGNTVVVSYAATSALAKQIEAGAPADVFISADVDWMDYLQQRGLVTPQTRVDVLHNALVLVAPVTSHAVLKVTEGFALATALGDGRLAIANPDSVPAGKYAKAALESLGVWASVESRIARTENVRAALALVSRGEAPFGIVYRTDALADKRVRIVDTLPPTTHPPIVYPAAIVATSKSNAARSLLEYLRSDGARSIWQRFGFEVAR